jgi:hypothetical protein
MNAMPEKCKYLISAKWDCSLCKSTIVNPPVIAVIAGHAIERAARHFKVLSAGVSTANHQMPLAAGRVCKC